MRRARQISLVFGISFLTFVLGAALAEYRHGGFNRNRPTAWQTLLSFENQDLGNLKPDAARTIQNAIDALTRPSDSTAFPYQPRLLRTMSNANGEALYILVEEQPLVMIPSESRIRVHLFDTAGRLLSRADFSAGWRTVLTTMSIQKNYYFDRDTLVVYGEYVFGGSPSQQHYVLVGNSLILAYLETNGKFDRNNYQDTNLTVGPLLSQRTVDDWESALNSRDNAEVTSALIWLGGSHWNGQAPPYEEDKPEAEKVSTLLSRDSVKKRLNDLANSEVPWVQITAKRALDPNGI
jgi:hypothetical protein